MQNFRYSVPSEITKIEVELTNRCNASCPSCSRTDFDGKPLRSLPLTDIKLESFQKILPPHWIANREIKLCGVFGDPMMASDALPIVDYIVANNGRVTINTNGGMRDSQFWEDLGRLLSQQRDLHQVIFSIDGLEDTNQIYRRNVSWSKLMENAQAFIGAGGPSHWDFLVFSHNEHQVQAVRELSHQLGFRKFTLKKTTRSSSVKKSTAIETALQITPSEILEFKNPSLKPSEPTMSSPRKDLFSFFRFHSEKDVECFSRGESSFMKQPDTAVYISANLRLWPCCWFADAEFPQKREIRELFRKYGTDFNSLENYSLEDILMGSWYQKDLVKSWNKVATCSPICSKNCNKKNPLNNEACEDTYFA